MVRDSAATTAHRRRHRLVLWHAQGLQTVTIGGVAGYFTGRTVSETVYDRITQKGISLGHR